MKTNWVFYWRIIAEAFGTLDEQMTIEQRSLTRYGLCFALRELTGSDIFLKLWKKRHGKTYWLPTSCKAYYPIRNKNYSIQEADNIRSLFACLMAAIGNEEFEKIIGGGK